MRLRKTSFPHQNTAPKYNAVELYHTGSSNLASQTLSPIYGPTEAKNFVYDPQNSFIHSGAVRSRVQTLEPSSPFFQHCIDPSRATQHAGSTKYTFPAPTTAAPSPLLPGRQSWSTYPTAPLLYNQPGYRAEPVQLHPILRYGFVSNAVDLDLPWSPSPGRSQHRCAAATSPSVGFMDIIIPSRGVALTVYPSQNRTVVTVGDVLKALSESLMDVFGKMQGFDPYGSQAPTDGRVNGMRCHCEGVNVLDHWRLRYRMPVGLCSHEVKVGTWLLEIGQKPR